MIPQNQEKPQNTLADVIAACGLYCAECPKFKNEKCPGFRANTKATWCKVRSCNITLSQTTCAECKTFSNLKDCKKLNNPISKIFIIIFKSDRIAGLDYIRANGEEAFCQHLKEKGKMAFKKGRNTNSQDDGPQANKKGAD